MRALFVVQAAKNCGTISRLHWGGLYLKSAFLRRPKALLHSCWRKNNLVDSRADDGGLLNSISSEELQEASREEMPRNKELSGRL